MTRSTELNPFGLTQREVDALNALIAHGNNKEAGRSIGVQAKTIESLTKTARQRMRRAADGVEISRLQAVVWWDRYTREQDEPQAIPETPVVPRPANSVFQMGDMAMGLVETHRRYTA